jgi:tetratricopeptide (TPR) repeat protein
VSARQGPTDPSVAAAIEAMRANRPLRAEEICRDHLLTRPASIDHLRLLGHALMKQRRLPEAEAQLRFALSLEPGSPLLHEDLGSALALPERYEDAIASFQPDFGEVWWSMANLKVFTFADAELAEMERQVARDDLGASADIHLRFALGKAHEDRGDYDRAWHYYDSGNQRQRMLVKHDPQELTIRQAKIREIFSRPFIEQHAGHGYEARDPIFMVGLPRSGSTLVEQIIASHSAVEGTAELSNLSKLAASIGRYRPDGLVFPKALRDVRRKDWRGWGMQYIEETRRYRSSGRPCFTDKLANNFPLVGLIHLILPNAKIINTRRHPYDNCLRLQAAVRLRAELHLRHAGPCRVLQELSRHHAALARGPAWQGAGRALRGDGDRPRAAGAPRALRTAVRGTVSALLRERARGAHCQLGAGAQAHLSRCARQVASLRSAPRPVEG